MKLFVNPKKAKEEFCMVRNIGDGELPYQPVYYEYYKELLTGRALEVIEKLEQEKYEKLQHTIYGRYKNWMLSKYTQLKLLGKAASLCLCHFKKHLQERI